MATVCSKTHFDVAVKAGTKPFTRSNSVRSVLQELSQGYEWRLAIQRTPTEPGDQSGHVRDLYSSVDRSPASNLHGSSELQGIARSEHGPSYQRRHPMPLQDCSDAGKLVVEQPDVIETCPPRVRELAPEWLGAIEAKLIALQDGLAKTSLKIPVTCGNSTKSATRSLGTRGTQRVEVRCISDPEQRRKEDRPYRPVCRHPGWRPFRRTQVGKTLS
jgi:hypothetical protein